MAVYCAELDRCYRLPIELRRGHGQSICASTPAAQQSARASIHFAADYACLGL